MGRSKKTACHKLGPGAGLQSAMTGKRRNSVRLALWDPPECVLSQWESGQRVMQCNSDAGKVAAGGERGNQVRK